MASTTMIPMVFMLSRIQSMLVIIAPAGAQP
jgi:hypothetical protein